MEKKTDGRIFNGGKREGSGNKKKPYATTTISFRVREEYRDELHAKFSPLIKAEEQKLIDKNQKK